MSVTIAPTGTQDLELGDFTTERGDVVADARLRYRVIGDVEAAQENGWILVFHALTGSADVEAWWGPLVVPGGALDVNRHAVLSANLLGGCYGSTSPITWQASHGRRFPRLSSLDLARAHLPLIKHLGIRRLSLVSGGSLGGMVALQWGRVSAVPVDRLVVFAAPAATSAQAIAWNAAQRMAIEADPAWQDGQYREGEGPTTGLAAARAIAMITYRSAAEFEERFSRQSSRVPGRFDADHYVALMDAMDLHDVGDIRVAAAETADRVGEVIGVGVDSDILYYPAEVRAWTDAYRAAGANARYVEIKSLYGHDAFLIEWDQVGWIMRER
jgi:homoserine O-acetyltransferase